MASIQTCDEASNFPFCYLPPLIEFEVESWHELLDDAHKVNAN